MILKDKKGFSMIELIATVTILGILSIISIVSVQGYVTKARINYYKSLEDNMVMSCRSYLETNKEYIPKVSGQVAKITLNTLSKSKYMKDSVIDYQKNECDKEKSYVQVFKYQDEYLYSAYLVCPGDEKQSPTSSVEFESLKIEYSKDVKTAKAKLTLQEKYGIVSYSYKIYKDNTLVYTSDVFNEHKNTKEITKSISLTSYTPGKIKISLTAINIYGVSKTISESTNNYIDKELPECIIKEEDRKGKSRQWAVSREIKLGCNDKDGVGCTRDDYTKIFMDDMKNGKIEIEDKSGNKTNCEVSVYVDVSSPSVLLNIYKANANGKKDEDSKPVQTTNIEKVRGDNTKDIQINTNVVNGWLNKKNYPYGVYIEVEYEDISGVNKVVWSENASFKTANLSDSKKLVNTTIISANKKVDDKKETGTFSLLIKDEGYRYGELVLTDIVGHKTTIKITAPIDRTPPDYSKSGEGSSTSWAKSRKLRIKCEDKISGCSKKEFQESITETTIVGTYSIQDVAGNIVWFDANVYVDTTPPSCGARKKEGSPSSWAKSRTVYVGCSDTHSGCKKSEFYSSFPKTTTSDGVTIITDTVTISDVVGNTTDCLVDVYVDTEPPYCSGSTYIKDYDWQQGTRYIESGCLDVDGVGCKLDKFPKEFSGTLTKSTIQIEDKLGNKRNCNTYVYLDNTPPYAPILTGVSVYSGSGNAYISDNNCSSLSLTSSQNQSCSYTVNVQSGDYYYINKGFSSYDALSGIGSSEFKYTCSGASGSYTEYNSWTSGYSPSSRPYEGTCTLKLRSTDNVGLTGSVLTVVERVNFFTPSS